MALAPRVDLSCASHHPPSPWQCASSQQVIGGGGQTRRSPDVCDGAGVWGAVDFGRSLPLPLLRGLPAAPRGGRGGHGRLCLHLGGRALARRRGDRAVGGQLPHQPVAPKPPPPTTTGSQEMRPSYLGAGMGFGQFLCFIIKAWVESQAYG